MLVVAVSAQASSSAWLSRTASRVRAVSATLGQQHAIDHREFERSVLTGRGSGDAAQRDGVAVMLQEEVAERPDGGVVARRGWLTGAVERGRGAGE
ncbi:MAG: hypothetical protein ACXVHB_23935 [Solirubrobacteraceae bacterium]